MKWLLWVIVCTLVAAGVAYLVLRWLAFRIAHHVAIAVESRLGSTLAAGASRVARPRPVSQVAVSPPELERYLSQLDRLAWLMDRVIPLPIVGGVGLDALLGLVPVAGDLVSLGISSMLIMRAAKLGAPPELLARLIAIQCIDLLAGAIPVIGDLADAGYHADERSVKLIREWVESTKRAF